MSVFDAIGARKGGASSTSTNTLSSNVSIGSVLSSSASQASKGSSTPVAGTSTSWHQVVLWFLGGVALLALADPAPTLATGLVVVLILGTLLNNWQLYVSYFGGNVSQAASAVKG